MTRHVLLLAVLPALFQPACCATRQAPPAQTTEKNPAQDDAAWNSLVAAIHQHGVISASQTHARQVTVVTGDGVRHTAIEPRIDDIIQLADENPVKKTQDLGNGHTVTTQTKPVIATE